MKLKIIFGEQVPSCCYRAPFYAGEEEGMCPYVTSSHQVTFSNEFAIGWRGITNSNGSRGSWYMGYCFIHGLDVLTVKQFKKILNGISEKIGDTVYGTTLNKMQLGIKNKMDKFINYIVSNSSIALENIYWEPHINSSNIQYMLNAESKNMVSSSSMMPPA